MNNLLVAMDSGSASVVFLECSAAFDDVDHCILLDRLKNDFGIAGHVRHR